LASINDLAIVGQMVGEPARAAMLMALLDGRALTAGELARVAGVSAPTASGHLSALTQSRFLTAHPQGRHRYYRLASTEVAEMLERMLAVADGQGGTGRKVRTGPRDPALRRLRTCYDHMAGSVAVALFDRLTAPAEIDGSDPFVRVTAEGRRRLSDVGVALPIQTDAASPIFCKPCMDWSERRFHLGGEIGRRLHRGFLSNGWVRSEQGSRALTLTSIGRMILEREFGVTVGVECVPADR
jgi:DNA-binding transcriptional ArsR family regulator